jgi:hypothetical protein
MFLITENIMKCPVFLQQNLFKDINMAAFLYKL